MSILLLMPAVLWLAFPALALLILFRLLRARRRVVIAGSLLIWNRLALLPVTTRPKRIIFDRSLLLQMLAISALIGALSRPTFAPRESIARTILIVLDNGPLSRARGVDGKPLIEKLVERTSDVLSHLDSRDRVFIAQSAPIPMLLNEKPLDPRAAADTVAAITPALSGPSAASIWLFSTDRARALGRDDSAQVAIVSMADNPIEAQRNNGDTGKKSALWLCASDESKRLDNIGIVEAGSIRANSKANPGARVLVRIGNFSATSATGSVRLESLENSSAKTLDERALAIEAGKDATATFSVADEVKSPLRLTWRNAGKTPDALPEDDSVVLAPRPAHAPRVRFHAPQPAIEDVFRYGPGAEFVSPLEDIAAQPVKAEDIDLDVYVGSVPERLPDDTRAALFVAPERGYHSYFDVGEMREFKKFVVAQRGDDDPLTAEISAGANEIDIRRAVEILKTGDYKTLLRESESGRALAAKFIDEKSRPCYVLAFSPGDGLSPDLPITKPLAAMLTRMALETAHAGPPYVRATAAELEAATGRPLPLAWRPGFESALQTGSGVLSESASDLKIGSRGENSDKALANLLAAQGTSTTASFELAPWLIALGLLCACLEFLRMRE